MDKVNRQLPEKLKSLRGEMPLNQLSQATGIPRSLLYRFEMGTRTPNNETLQRLSGFFKLPFEVLKILHFEDLYPAGSLDRQVLEAWLSSNKPKARD